ncbi:indolepyruvate oxidoreductase subunit beta family protein [Rhodospirillaceae bacterium KN72]|uniref:Indolepyruvate oxidoreductase subunit beta family protein n=1 Tax=Pacificispira spongiicola TaxID=2729598 RepID=A0A7Y0HH77_9PROT|nr:indolepyruvate oxidoreductase subunit beta family protein [Pacificispira spongiicola]NMM45637.1 indolepyruvate oxidoreductase subunit beta family protein [Pacificispira spongiicola]
MTIETLPGLPERSDDATASIIKLAILAVGGQGGGVLTDWITAVAERNGYCAQSTSVAGVAQRTGATIYYVEMAPDTGRAPVFALSPSAGDVDIMIAAEMMEAGRSIQRGFCTPDRTVLIASSHRVLAVSEKIVPGDGRADTDRVWQAARDASHKLVCFDMEKLAIENGSVISASLFGALAGSGALPFDRTSFEDTVKASGRGVEASLRAFSAAYDRAVQGDIPAAVDAKTESKGNVSGSSKLMIQWRTLEDRIATLPPPVRAMAELGLRKVVDFQDIAYGAAYLDRLDKAVAMDSADHGFAFSIEAAKYIANAMVYDDIVRVADLKTRSTRETRLRREQGVPDTGIVQVTEYFHPRMEEICGLLPARLGRWMENHPAVFGWFDRRVNKGRRIRTDRLTGFCMLWIVAGLRRWRRGMRRHEVETAHLDDWFTLALAEAKQDYALGVEILKCRRLIKGYSDTYDRGHSKFQRVLSGLPVLRGRGDAADWLRRLRDAALSDEKGDALGGALKTIATL